NICVNIKPKPSIYTASGFFCAGQPDTLSAFGASTYTWLPFNLTGPNIVISPSVSGCYTVIGTNTAGCTNTTTGCYSVAPIPNITVSGNNAVCAGGSTTLTATGATSYFWSPGGFTGSSIVVSPSVNTCYTVTGYNAYGCSNKTVKCVSVQPGAVISISGNNVLCGGSSANLIASGAASYTWSNGMTGPFITVSPSVSTCYSVIGQTNGGCTGMAVKCITVQNIPFLTVTGNTNICQGSSATLQASGAASYWWNTGATSSAIVVNPNVSTSYMVIGSNGACQSSINVNVTVRPKPFVFILGGDSTMVCAGDALTLTAVGASTYTWNNSSTGSMITVTPTASTVYSVVGTSTNNCTNSAAKLIVVNACTGISANTMSESDVQIYPNPSSGLVTISNQSAESLNVKVYDMIGRELLKKQINGTQTLDLSNYANGTYIVRFEKGNKTLYKKLIIE
ncbi:MAG: T9SS type A sorting domain-containing protein, partial [Bacteroidia bacterium]|nr:T9SS type A sorting domain-containing protein [Bacteroidia bacterium]